MSRHVYASHNSAEFSMPFNMYAVRFSVQVSSPGLGLYLCFSPADNSDIMQHIPSIHTTPAHINSCKVRAREYCYPSTKGGFSKCCT